MIMIGHDGRKRCFKPLKLLKERGLDVNEVAKRGNEVLLKPSYTYTYMNKPNTVPVQEYKWDAKVEQWIIL